MPVTLEDIARALNVSKMTVSRAINDHPEISRVTRERILATARKMNYRPNQFARVPLTTVSWSKAEMGQAAASLVLELIDGKKKARCRHTITVPPELLIRDSCGHR